MPRDEGPSRGIWIEPSGAGKALLIDGTVQSVSLSSAESLFGYWTVMLPAVRPSNALILGLGGGTLAQLLIKRFGPVPLTGVDDTPSVIELATSELGLDPADLTIIFADAFEWAANTRERYDYVAIDLYRGGDIPRQVFSTAFLSNIRRIVSRRGLVVVNMAKDADADTKLGRLSRFFRLEQVRPVGKNLIVHARPRGK